MQRITWYSLLVVTALVDPIAGRAQTPPTQTPQPKVREIATIPGVAVNNTHRMPNGRVVLYAVEDGIFAYDLASKRSRLVTRGFDGELGMSPAGDRVAYDHESSFIWSTPIDPTTGAATGPAQRVTVREGDEATFSPDGKLIAFEGFGGRTKNLLAVVPVTGGPERVLADYEDTIHSISWSVDAKWLFVNLGHTRIERIPAAGGRSEKVISVSGRIEGPIDLEIVFYRPDARALPEGRMAYSTTSGAHGEFSVPPGSRAGELTRTKSTASWLFTKSVSEGAPTSTIYEVDMMPILQAVVRR